MHVSDSLVPKGRPIARFSLSPWGPHRVGSTLVSGNLQKIQKGAKDDGGSCQHYLDDAEETLCACVHPILAYRALRLSLSLTTLPGLNCMACAAKALPEATAVDHRLQTHGADACGRPCLPETRAVPASQPQRCLAHWTRGPQEEFTPICCCFRWNVFLPGRKLSWA